MNTIPVPSISEARMKTMIALLVFFIVVFVLLGLFVLLEDGVIISEITDPIYDAVQRRRDDAAKKRNDDAGIKSYFEHLASEHRSTPKGDYDCTFEVYYDETHQKRGGSYLRMCVDRHGERIYDDGFDDKQKSYIRQYFIEMEDEIAHLKMKEAERIQAQKKAAEIEREEDLRLHPWKKHMCCECGHYSYWRYDDGDEEAECGYTGQWYSCVAVPDFACRTACEHFKSRVK